MSDDDQRVQSPCILAIDIGSSSTRVGLVDAQLTPVPDTLQQVKYAIETGPDGRATLDSESLFRQVCELIDRVLASGVAVHAAGISCFWHSLMGIDDSGKPTTPVLTWAETRAASSAKDFAALDPGLHQRTGTPPHPSYPAIKLRWLRETCPETWKRTARWLSFAEYLQLRLHGEARVSRSMASGSGLLSRQSLTWDAKTCSLAGDIERDQLSAIDDTPFVSLVDEFARRWPSLASIPWYPAIGDGAANNLGSGATDSSHPALMIGTTGAMRLVTDSPPEILSEGLWQYRIDGRRALLGGALSEGGGVLDWLFRNLQLPDDNELDQALSSQPPDGHGLTVLPWFAGERSPGWNPEATASIHGLRMNTTAVEITRAVMESVAYSFAEIFEQLEPLLIEPVEVIATGNGLRKNRVWIQIIADTLGYPLLLPASTEASLRGAARFVLEREAPAHLPHGLTDMDRFEPVSERHMIYRQALQRRRDLQERLG